MILIYSLSLLQKYSSRLADLVRRRLLQMNGTVHVLKSWNASARDDVLNIALQRNRRVRLAVHRGRPQFLAAVALFHPRTKRSLYSREVRTVKCCVCRFTFNCRNNKYIKILFLLTLFAIRDFGLTIFHTEHAYTSLAGDD